METRGCLLKAGVIREAFGTVHQLTSHQLSDQLCGRSCEGRFEGWRRSSSIRPSLARLPNISIDYAVMERPPIDQRVGNAVRGAFDWSDSAPGDALSKFLLPDSPRQSHDRAGDGRSTREISRSTPASAWSPQSRR